MTDQVRKILDCYRSENPGVLTNLAGYSITAGWQERAG